MAESEQITYHATTSQTEIQNRSQIFVAAPEVPVLRVRKSHFYCFSSLQKSHFRCPKQKSETCSEIPSVTVETVIFFTTLYCLLACIVYV